MKSILNCLTKFRMVFIVLSLIYLSLAVGKLTVQSSAGLFYWNPDPIEEGAGDVIFSAYGTYDEYRWWISDGPGNFCDLSGSPETNATFTRTMIQSGDWEVCLQVPDIDEPGGYDTDRQKVTVNNLPPAIDEPAFWTATPEPSFVSLPFHVEVPFTDYEDQENYTCTIDYGDGSEEQTGSIQHLWDYAWLCVGPEHTYPTTCQFNIHATVFDEYPYSSSTSSDYYHTVDHLFSWDPTETLEGGYTTFTAIDGYIQHYWTRGSQPDDLCNMPASYYYTSPVDLFFGTSGEYQVCLGMFDKVTNIQVFDSQWVTIKNVAPSGIDLQTSPQPSFPGLEISLDGHFTDYSDGPYTIVINWGDGSAPETILVDNTYFPDQYHTYELVGTYTIQVSVTDKDKANSTKTITHDVSTVIVQNNEFWLVSDTHPTTIKLLGATVAGTSLLDTSIASDPSHGDLTNLSDAVCQPYDKTFSLCVASVTYTPDGTYPAGIDDHFTFTMSKGTITSLPGMITLWIAPNSAPTAQSGPAIVSQVSPSYVLLTATDPDIYEDFKDQITFTIDSQPQNGTLGIPGNPNCEDFWNDQTSSYDRRCTSAVLYTPFPGTTAAEDSFSFHVNDTHQNSNTAMVSLSLHAPVTLHVNTENYYGVGECDTTECSLFEAVNAAMVGDTIDFTLPLPAIIYVYGEQPIRIDKSIFITGPGAHYLAISGAQSNRVFEFNNDGLPIIASVSGLTIKDGRANEGGGIFIGDAAEVTVTDCIIGPNNIVNYAGGGIANMGGKLTLIRSAVVENHGTGTLGGAGIVSAYSNSITNLINSTVTGNVTNNYGGGILAAYGGRVNLIHSTVTGNTANENFASEAWGGGGGIAIIDDGIVTIQNSIVAGNMDLTNPDTADHPVWTDVSGTFYAQLDGSRLSGHFVTLGGNLIGDGTGSTGWGASDQVGTASSPKEAKLNALTMDIPDEPELPEPLSLLNMPDAQDLIWDKIVYIYELVAGSSAIDSAPSCAAATDQRGISRPQGRSCDIGAFEVENPTKYLFLPLIRR